MKNNFNFKMAMLVMVIVSTFVVSCEKSVGEKGPIGETGMTGPAGSTILSGSTAPATALGAIGDFYLDLSTSNFYGPKKAEGWGAPFSMKGANGATGPTGANGNNGAPGSKILSGTVVPGADIGALGDYYLDKTTYSLYGPKTETGWGIALSLKGTANVIYSGWNTAKNFRDTTIDNSVLRIADVAAPALTTALLNNASLQVYFNYGGGVLPLPYSSYAGGKLNTISYIPRAGRFTITRFAADNSGSVALSTVLQYRYVIIPGGVAVANKPNQPLLDLKDYEAVKKMYHIGN